MNVIEIIKLRDSHSVFLTDQLFIDSAIDEMHLWSIRRRKNRNNSKQIPPGQDNNMNEILAAGWLGKKLMMFLEATRFLPRSLSFCFWGGRGAIVHLFPRNWRTLPELFWLISTWMKRERPGTWIRGPVKVARTFNPWMIATRKTLL